MSVLVKKTDDSTYIRSLDAALLVRELLAFKLTIWKLWSEYLATCTSAFRKTKAEITKLLFMINLSLVLIVLLMPYCGRTFLLEGDIPANVESAYTFSHYLLFPASALTQHGFIDI